MKQKQSQKKKSTKSLHTVKKAKHHIDPLYSFLNGLTVKYSEKTCLQTFFGSEEQGKLFYHQGTVKVNYTKIFEVQHRNKQGSGASYADRAHPGKFCFNFKQIAKF